MSQGWARLNRRSGPNQLAKSITASVTSMLHSGHSDGVFLGTPVIICILSRLFSSRQGAQEGFGNSPSGRIALKFVERLHATFDAARKTRAGTGNMGR